MEEEGEMKQISKIRYFNYPVTSVNSSFDDQMLTASSKDHMTLVWNSSEENKVNYTLVGHSDIVTCSDFISNDVVGTSSYDSTFRLWKLN
jgi:WD40 repeat protein